MSEIKYGSFKNGCITCKRTLCQLNDREYGIKEDFNQNESHNIS